MQLYTFLMEFRDGTYINQVNAPDIKEAVKNWAYSLNIKEIKFLSETSKQQLLKDLPELLKEFPPTPIDNLKNVWFLDYQFKTGFANINIIKTDKK